MKPPDKHDSSNGKLVADAADQELLGQIHRRTTRMRLWLRDGEPTVTRQLAAVGILGWIIVIPALLGLVLGRWLDRWGDSGIVLTAAFMFLGLLLGCWSAWRWMHQQ